MRSDYALYAVAIIFFILTGITLVYPVESKELWVTSTIVLGLIFIVLGYNQRPKATAKPVTAEAPPPTTPPTPPVPAVQEPAVEAPAVQEKIEAPEEVRVPAPTPAPQAMEGLALTEVKGIGEKRAAQLRNIGVNTVEELAKASAEDLAARLKVSQKITSAWIENAKKLVEKS